MVPSVGSGVTPSSEGQFMVGSFITTAPDTWPDISLTISWQLSEGKMMERRKKIALELSELVVYCRPVPFDEESEHLLSWWPSLWHYRPCGVPLC